MTIVIAIRSYSSSDPAAANCPCRRCTGYPADQPPVLRAELEHGSRRLLAAVAAMTHARLGVDPDDSHVDLPASHCDIDRAMHLIETLASTPTTREVSA